MKLISYKIGRLFSLLFIISFAITSCDFDYELPEAGSLTDNTLPTAAFSSAQTDAEDFRIVTFTNQSGSATTYNWNFGTGDTSSDKDPSYRFEGEGVFTVSLEVSDGNGVMASVSKDINVVKPEEPDDIVPTVLNGDFEGGQDDWKIESFTDGTTSPFNSSSDGSPNDYDGNDTGGKTPGAKWTMSTSAAHLLSDNSRFAYQAFTVSPNKTYVVEWEYAIKNDSPDVTGGDRLVLQILDGHFGDGKDALSASTILETTGDQALGKGNFTNIKAEFETNSTGQIAIWIYGVTSEDAYADNVKLYPKG